MCISRLTTLLILLAGVFLGAHLVAQERVPTLEGIIDFHVHSGPDSRPRAMNDIEPVRLAKEAGLRGVVLKNHFTMTADRAALAMAAVEDIEVFGGVVLNRAVGGLNVEAVRQMVQFEGGRGKVVWLPTFDAEYFVRAQGTSAPFVPVVAIGSPVPSLLEIFSVIAEHDLVLATGHSSPDEVLRMIPEARRAGVERILVTHVFGQNPTRDQMRRMADTGAVLELDWYAVYRGAHTTGLCGGDRGDRVEALPDLVRPWPAGQPGAWRRFADVCWSPASGRRYGTGYRCDGSSEPGETARAGLGTELTGDADE